MRPKTFPSIDRAVLWMVMLHLGAFALYFRLPAFSLTFMPSLPPLGPVEPCLVFVLRLLLPLQTLAPSTTLACVFPLVALVIHESTVRYARLEAGARFDERDLFFGGRGALRHVGFDAQLLRFVFRWTAIPILSTMPLIMICQSLDMPMLAVQWCYFWLPLAILMTASMLAAATTVWCQTSRPDMIPEDATRFYPLSELPILSAGLTFVSYALAVYAWLHDRAGAEIFSALYVILTCIFLGLLLAWADRVGTDPLRRRSTLRWVLAVFVAAFSASTVAVAFIQPAPSASLLQPLWTGWALAVVPFLTVAPGVVIACRPRAVHARSESKAATPASDRMVWWLITLEIHLVRGHHILLAIARENPTAFVVSLAASIAIPLQPVQAALDRAALGLFSVLGWLGVTIAWLLPFLRSLMFIDDTLARAYAFGLHRALQALNGHLLVLGYGDLGRRLVDAQFKERAITCDTLHEHIEMSRNIIMPSGKLGKLLLRVAVVDLKGNHLHSEARTPDHLRIAVADVPFSNHRVEHPLDSLVSCVIPAVIGDAARAEEQRLAGLEHSAFVCCFTRPPESGLASARVIAHRLKELARRRAPIPALIALHASRDVSFVTLSATVDRLPWHVLLPEHIEGLNAAHVLHAAYVKYRRPGGTSPRILLCGRGQRLYYIVDSFLKELSYLEYARLRASQLTDAPAVVLFANADEFKRLVVPGASSMLTCAKDVVRFNLLTARNPLRPEPAKDEPTRMVPEVPFDVPYRGGDTGYDSLRDLLKTYTPDIVLISDHTGADELRLLQSVIQNATRLRDEPCTDRPGAAANGPVALPLILVSGETGQDHLRRNLKDALDYYAATWGESTGDDHATVFPGPFVRNEEGQLSEGAPLIDVLEDPVERACALIRTYCSDLPPGAVPLELDLCTPDEPGELAFKLARLAGYSGNKQRTVTQGCDERNCRTHTGTRSSVVFSMRNFRGRLTPQLNRKGRVGSAELRAFASLEQEAAPGEERGATTADGKGIESQGLMEGESPNWDKWARVRVTYGAAFTNHVDAGQDAVNPNDVCNAVMQCLGNERIPCDWSTSNREQITGHIKDCCGMPTCPVEGIHKIVEATRQTLRKDYATPDDRRELETAIGRAFGVPPWPKGNPPSADRPMDTAPLAYVSVRAHNCLTPGVLAVVANALMLRAVVRYAETNAPLRHVFNLFSVTGYNCHDSRFGVTTCYGRMQVRAGSVDPPNIQDILDEIIIRPITSANRWKRYALRLARFLTSVGAGGWMVNSRETGVIRVVPVPDQIHTAISGLGSDFTLAAVMKRCQATPSEIRWALRAWQAQHEIKRCGRGKTASWRKTHLAMADTRPRRA